MPVIVAGIIASVTSPLVDWLRRHGVPRGIGAGLVFLAIIAVGVGVGLIVLTGIASQADSLSERLREGASEIESLVGDLGVSATTAANANADASASISAGFEALTHGLLGGVDKLASLAVFLSFTALSLFFLLKDAPTIGGFVERHLGVPVPVAHSMLGRVAGSLRGYFLGVTVVSALELADRRRGRAAPRRPPARHDRGRHLRRRVRPLPRRLDGGRLRGPDRPRRRGARRRRWRSRSSSCWPTASCSSWSSRSPTARPSNCIRWPC